MILNKFSFKKIFIDSFLAKMSRSYSSTVKIQVSKDIIKALISEKLISYMTKMYQKPEHLSYRDQVLEYLTTQNVEKLIQPSKDSNNINEFDVSIPSSELRQAVEEMRAYFIEGVNVDLRIYDQGRFKIGSKDSTQWKIEKAEQEKKRNFFKNNQDKKMSQQKEKVMKKVAFFPTSFSYPAIFSILKKGEGRFLTLGTAGSGKSLALVFLSMLSNNINRCMFSATQNKVKYFGLSSPKVFYFSFNQYISQKKLIESLRNQSQQFSSEIQKMTDLKDICQKLQDLYSTKTGEQPILIIDQINFIMSMERQKKNTQKFVKMLTDIQLLSSRIIYNSSVNIQKEILLDPKFEIQTHYRSLSYVSTSFIPFTKAVREQLGLYFFFQLWQRDILKAKNTSSDIVNDILIDLLKEDQKVSDLLDHFAKDLDFLPKSVTPLVINRFAKKCNQDKRIVSNQKEIIQIIDDFKKYIKKVTDKKLIKFIQKGSDEMKIQKLNLLQTYLKLIYQIKSKNKLINHKQEEYQKKDPKSKIALDLKEEIKKLTDEKDALKRQYKEFQLHTFDQDHFGMQSFDRQLFEVQNERETFFQNLKEYHLRPNVSQQYFEKIVKDIWIKKAEFWLTYAHKNPYNFSKLMWKWIQSEDSKGVLFEDIIFDVLRDQKTKIEFNFDTIQLNGQMKFLKFQEKQQSFEECFTSIFERFKKQKGENIFCLSVENKGNIGASMLSKNNPSVDFVIAEMKTQGIIFHMFDLTITVPYSKNQVKAQKVQKLLHTFTEFRKKTQDKDGFITSKAKKVKYKVKHYILGLRKTKEKYSQSDLQRKNLRGVSSISFLNIVDFKVQNDNSDLEKLMKTFKEVIKYLNKNKYKYENKQSQKIQTKENKSKPKL